MASSVELNLQGSCSARLPEPVDLEGMPEGLSVLQGCFFYGGSTEASRVDVCALCLLEGINGSPELLQGSF